MSKKRRRERPAVDVELVEIFEDLANVDKGIQLKAAQILLVKFVSGDQTNVDQLNEILRRLFKGLCSNRKAARLGFSVALTEFLVELLGPKGKKVPGFKSIPELITILLEQTRISGNNVSGQEERDHQFGRLFGLEAIIQSGILFHSDTDIKSWNDILDTVFELAKQKPWLREECGFVLNNAIKVLPHARLDYIESLFEKLKHNKLLKTPEGVAIWISAKSEFSGVHFPPDVWKHGNPLSKEEKSSLARILREGGLIEEPHDASESKILQKGNWIPKINFAWDVIIAKLLQAGPAKEKPKETGNISFKAFWEECIDTERFLHQIAKKTEASIVMRSTSDHECTIPILRGFLTKPLGTINFDKITKSKLIQALLSHVQTSKADQLLSLYEELLLRPGSLNEKEAAFGRNVAADQLVSVLRNVDKDDPGHVQSSAGNSLTRGILGLLARCAYFDLDHLEHDRPDPPITSASREVFRTRITSSLAYLLAQSADNAYLAFDLVKMIHEGEVSYEPAKLLFSADETVSKVILNAWRIFEYFSSKAQAGKSGPIEQDYSRSILLLYSLTLIQIFNEDTEALSILEELNGIFGGHKPENSSVEGSAALVEILLSFISKPSQLFRRLVHQVLETRESLSGQVEMFEQVNDDQDHADSISEASDVEEVGMAEKESAEGDSEDEDDDDTDVSVYSAEMIEGEDDELAAFDAKIAQALGTRPCNDIMKEGDSTSSDEDMNDEQMEALDEQLAKVFRERKKLTSKKTEEKEAKETVVNFKSKVLDLLETYVKQQHTSILALSLLLPILTLIRTTTSPQISGKACNLLRGYSKLCKGDGVPKIKDAETMYELLEQIHIEAGKEASNAHTSACSQASLLVIKVLVNYDRESLRRVIKIYGSTREKFLFDPDCKVKTAFFTEWSNWCTSARP
ncbi:DNA-directed DNA polymerase [Lecanora helva]